MLNIAKMDNIGEYEKGKLEGLAEELGRLAERAHTSALAKALRAAAQMFGGGFGGYLIGLIMDNFDIIEALLP